MKIPTENLVNRFLRYVQIDTQSDENSKTYPSTEKQLNLSRMLENELKELGLSKVKMTPHGYVFATLPSNLPPDHPVNVPPIGFIAHVDTSPEVSGANVKPVIHKNYQGGAIVLPKDESQCLKPETDPALNACIGHDIITSDGSTLLGADNKAGIAEIMTAVEYLLHHAEVKHGDIRIAFTVDEEVGEGTKYFDIQEFGAKYAYTIDGETAGEVEDETFCADTVIMTIQGVNMHPGYAKGKLVSAIKIAADIVTRLPRHTLSPETTEKREGYIHPHAIEGGVEKTTLKFLIRDFTVEGLKEKENLLRQIMKQILLDYPRAQIKFKVNKSYRNMRYVLDNYPFVVDYALRAISQTGLEPKKNLIRGGTDGARLSYKGLPTPNIFTGGHNFHSKKEWISIQDMEKAAETIVRLAEIWATEGEPLQEKTA
ncbi:MAG: peptidase T [Calditrichia bacterium]